MRILVLRKRHLLWAAGITIAIVICLIGYYIYSHSDYVTFSTEVNSHKGKSLAVGKGIKITDNDIEKYKIYNYGALSSDFTDEKILNMMIEEAVVLQEASNQGIKITKDEVNEFLGEQKYIVEHDITPEDRGKFSSMVKSLGLSDKEYWNEYAPKVYARILAFGRMREILKDNIEQEILRNSGNISSEEFVKQRNSTYEKKINELREKYQIKLQ